MPESEQRTVRTVLDRLCEIMWRRRIKTFRCCEAFHKTHQYSIDSRKYSFDDFFPQHYWRYLTVSSCPEIMTHKRNASQLTAHSSQRWQETVLPHVRSQSTLSYLKNKKQETGRAEEPQQHSPLFIFIFYFVQLCLSFNTFTSQPKNWNLSRP